MRDDLRFIQCCLKNWDSSAEIGNVADPNSVCWEGPEGSVDKDVTVELD